MNLTRTMKLTIRSGVFTVNFEHISHFFLLFRSLALNRCLLGVFVDFGIGALLFFFVSLRSMFHSCRTQRTEHKLIFQQNLHHFTSPYQNKSESALWKWRHPQKTGLFFLFFILRRYKFLIYKFTNSTMNINSYIN